jgi:hypothetical protein
MTTRSLRTVRCGQTHAYTERTKRKLIKRQASYFGTRLLAVEHGICTVEVKAPLAQIREIDVGSPISIPANRQRQVYQQQLMPLSLLAD